MAYLAPGYRSVVFSLDLLVFFKRQRTVSREISVTIPRFFNSLVNNLKLQCALPDGGSQQHRAISCASSSPSSNGGFGGTRRGRRLRAGSTPS